MEQHAEASVYLLEKMQLLEKIAVNTETQCRFIQQRKMRGLGRLLREREALIGRLSLINGYLANDVTWKQQQSVRRMLQEISRRQQEVFERSRQVLQEAVQERMRIAAELKSSRMRRQVKNQYVNPWATVTRGSRINERG